jgi:hypothetical protein
MQILDNMFCEGKKSRACSACSMQFLHPVFELQMSLMASLKASDPQGDVKEDMIFLLSSKFSF